MACHADVNKAESVFFSACEPEVSGWGIPNSAQILLYEAMSYLLPEGLKVGLPGSALTL